MKIVFRTAAIAAFVLTAASFGLALAASPAKADGWHRNDGWTLAYRYGDRRDRYWRGHRRGRTVVVVRPAPVYAPPRVVYVQPAPQVVQAAPPPVQASGSYCREYTETVTIAGTVHTAYGTACQQPDGSWRKMD
jgi:hypothetical protein